MTFGQTCGRTPPPRGPLSYALTMIRPRALTWVACFLYVSVLIAGIAVAWTEPCPGGAPRVGAFIGVLGLAVGLEFAETRLPATRATAVAWLFVRAAVFTVITGLDCAGNAKVLFVLIPLTAYFTVGHRIAFALGAAGLLAAGGLVGARAELRRDPEALSDLLMLAVGVVFALAIAVVAHREEVARRRAEALLTELTEANIRLREYADQAVSSAAIAERSRLARDIHDSVGHHLVVAAIQLEKAAAYRDVDGPAADAALAQGRDSTRRALEEIRRTVGALRSDDTEFTLAPILRALVTRLDEPGFRIALEIDGTDAELPETVRLTVYLIAQEALTNARKHAEATAVTVRAALDPAACTLEIADNGKGFAPETADGQGLTGMRERLALVGGELAIDSGESGTRLTATIPGPA
ncbi:sensor histidine kinase [Nocardia crassostreae]|uniref:sensor histidine kinase n=1 Tax=Nocardia crassostreae TaxID=53428 RepID=UPI00082E03EF|nr:sensor histidine kinase [Nocardia crassostreae]